MITALCERAVYQVPNLKQGTCLINNGEARVDHSSSYLARHSPIQTLFNPRSYLRRYLVHSLTSVALASIMHGEDPYMPLVMFASSWRQAYVLRILVVVFIGVRSVQLI